MKLQSLVLAAATALTMTTAFAVPAGTWTVGVGIAHIEPDSKNGSLGDIGIDHIDPDVRPTITGEYFVADNVGVELLGALPFHHDMVLNLPDSSQVEARTQHLPPTLSLQYHFDGYNLPMNVKPFVGVGLNYTTFFKERIYLGNGNDLDIKDSWGAAGHVGVDFKINTTDAVRVDARYIDLEPDVKLNGEKIGKAEINPWVYGLSYVKNF